MKTYIAKVQGQVSAQTISKLTKGIELDDGPIAADKARAMPGGGTGATAIEEHESEAFHCSRIM
jgi:23S rRNA pseudouridine2605 synthase/16S rRNA pseudouridine516 synthase